MSDSIGFVISSSPAKILVRIEGLDILEKNKSSLQIGRYLKVDDGNHNFAVVSISNIGSVLVERNGKQEWVFDLEACPIGALLKQDEGYSFTKSAFVLPVPTERVHILEDNFLEVIYSLSSKHSFQIGLLASNKSVPIFLDGDRFFAKHIGVVGSTGSGKSCAVANILQNAVGISDGKYPISANQNNSHIVIFDLHSEYASAFKLDSDQGFTLNELTIDKLQLPFWLMNSEELESMFIESNESNSHNQISIFKKAVILNKKKYNKGLEVVNYDTPCYFSLREVLNFIDNSNREVIGRLEGEGKPKLADGNLVGEISQYFEAPLEFVVTSTAKDSKATTGPFNGEFTRFISRLETRMADERLSFILSPKKESGAEYGSADFPEILKQFIGYIDKSNVSIVDLSGIPFEVLSITVSLISRLIFDFGFHYSKIRHANDQLNDIPILIVCEEAHNYVPSNDSAAYRASRKSIERIAKEGRKYGISLMVVSQRPSEVSPTIYAQCNNFIALRLTNTADQSYVKNLLPENARGAAEILPNLAQGEALVVGDAAVMSTVVSMKKPVPEPKSASVSVYEEWKSPWKVPTFEDVVSRWRR